MFSDLAQFRRERARRPLQAGPSKELVEARQRRRELAIKKTGRLRGRIGVLQERVQATRTRAKMSASEARRARAVARELRVFAQSEKQKAEIESARVRELLETAKAETVRIKLRVSEVAGEAKQFKQMVVLGGAAVGALLFLGR